MLKYYNLNEIYNIIINYIENNKKFNNIKYKDSIIAIIQLIDEIKQEYENIKGE